MTEFSTVSPQERPFGAEIHDILTQSLGNYAYFPDTHDTIAELRERIASVETVEITPEALTQAVNTEQAAIGSHGWQQRLGAHGNMAKSNNILLPKATLTDNEESHEWQPVSPTIARQAQATIEAVTQEGPEATIEDIHLCSFTTEDAKLFVVTHFAAQIEVAFMDIPQPQRTTSSRIRQIARLSLKPAMSADDFIFELPTDPNEQQRVRRNIMRSLRHVSNELKIFTANPSKYAANLLVSPFADALATNAAIDVDNRIATAHEAYAYAKEERVARPDQTAKRTGHTAMRGANIASAPEVLPAEEPKLELSQTEAVALYLPWVSAEAPVDIPLQKVSLGDKTVYLAYGMSPQAQDISKTVRHGAGASFDNLAMDIVRTRLKDVPLRENRGLIKTLLGDARPGYPKQIWYGRKRGSKARVYFASNELGSVSAGQLPEGCNPQDECIIVLGESNKTRQVQLLKHITRQTRRELQNTGVGQ